jgi:hypothetical protein
MGNLVNSERDVEMMDDGDGANSIGSDGNEFVHKPKRNAPAYMFNSSDGSSSGSGEPDLGDQIPQGQDNAHLSKKIKQIKNNA